MAQRPPSLRNVAEKAGCSISAASAVLNKSRGNIGVGEEMRAAIVRAAEELGYRANYHGKALQTGRSLCIGLVHPSDPHRESYFGEGLTQGVERRTHELGYDLLMFGHDRRQKALDSLAEKRVDGLILSAPAAALAKCDEPWPIVLARQAAGGGYPSVQLDPMPGIRQAVDHLAEMGHEHVLHFGMKEGGKQQVPERRKAYLKAMRAAGMRVEELSLNRPKGFSLQLEQQLAWYTEALRQSLAYSDGITAIVCYNDLLALALYAVLAERGIRIPDDMSVIGFDNLFAELAIPGLTTVSHMLPEIGARAVDLLMEVIDQGQAFPHEVEVTIPAELVQRASVRSLR